MRLKELAELYNLEISPNLGDVEIRYTGGLGADSPHLLSFFRMDRFERYRSDFLNTRAEAVLVSENIEERVALEGLRSSLLFTTDDDATLRIFYEIHNQLCNQECSIIRVSKPMVHREATIAGSAKIIGPVRIGGGVNVMDGAYIGRHVIIGDRTTIQPNSVILDNVRIGSDCFIGGGTVIGGEGFRYLDECGDNLKVNHYGGVILGDKVEIGSNSSIDRATFFHDATDIGDNVKINNLVHIAHNVSIGKDSFICAHVSISGSTKIGEKVYIAPFAAIKNNARIGRGAKVLMGSVVATDIAEGEMISGNFAMPHRQWKKGNTFIRSLDKERGTMRKGSIIAEETLEP